MKKITTYIVVLILILFTNEVLAQNSEISKTLNNITSRMEQSNALSCEVNYLCKMLYSQKTERVKAYVEMIRSNSDRNFGCIFWYKINDTLEKYYDGKNLYHINHKAKKIITQSANDGDLDLVTQELDGDVIRLPFVAPKSISGLTSLEKKIKIFNYKKIKNSQLVNVKYPDEKGVSGAEMELVFDKKNFDILRIFSKMIFKGQTQTNEWNISNIKYGLISEKALKERYDKLNNLYKKEKFQKPLHQFQNKQ